jgi:hypothetical protein
MSGDIILRDRNGVFLRYSDPSVRRLHHDERRPQPSDRERMALLRAERACLTLMVLAEHLDLSDIALTRINDELCAIQRALDLKRPRLGMQNSAQVAA